MFIITLLWTQKVWRAVAPHCSHIPSMPIHITDFVMFCLNLWQYHSFILWPFLSPYSSAVCHCYIIQVTFTAESEYQRKLDFGIQYCIMVSYNMILRNIMFLEFNASDTDVKLIILFWIAIYLSFKCYTVKMWCNTWHCRVLITLLIEWLALPQCHIIHWLVWYAHFVYTVLSVGS